MGEPPLIFRSQHRHSYDHLSPHPLSPPPSLRHSPLPPYPFPSFAPHSGPRLGPSLPSVPHPHSSPLSPYLRPSLRPSPPPPRPRASAICVAPRTSDFTPTPSPEPTRTPHPDPAPTSTLPSYHSQHSQRSMGPGKIRCGSLIVFGWLVAGLAA